jgi:hypothetical protein
MIIISYDLGLIIRLLICIVLRIIVDSKSSWNIYQNIDNFFKINPVSSAYSIRQVGFPFIVSFSEQGNRSWIGTR